MDLHGIIKNIEKKQIKGTTPDIRVGETVKVHYKIREGNKERVQVFEGLVIACKNGRAIQGSFTVRKVVSGVGVERTFPLHSPWIVKIERVKSGKVRRAKLYFVRRHAQSPKRFRLKDKGIAGTIWEEVAKEQEEIQQEEGNLEGSDVVATTESEEDAPAAQTEEDQTPEPVVENQENIDNSSNDKSEEGTGEDGGDAGGRAPTAEGSPDPGAEPTK